jgi:hypothetical protein
MLGHILLSRCGAPCPAASIVVLVVCPIAASCGYQKPNGQVTFITVDTDPDWSPEGRLIAFASSRRLGGTYPAGCDLREVLACVIVTGRAGSIWWSLKGHSGSHPAPRYGSCKR